MARRQWFALCAILALAVVPGVAGLAQEVPPEPDPFLSQMVGTWTGTGQFQGMAVTDNYTWQWTLGGHFLHGVNHGTITMADGTEAAIEVVFYVQPLGDGRYFGITFSDQGDVSQFDVHLDESGAFVADNRGEAKRVVAVVNGDEMSLTFQRGDDSGTFTPVGTVALSRQ